MLGAQSAAISNSPIYSIIQYNSRIVQNKARIRSLDHALYPQHHVSVAENAETKTSTDDAMKCNKVITDTEADHLFVDSNVRLAQLEVHLQHLEEDKFRLLEESLSQIQRAMVSGNQITCQAISCVKSKKNALSAIE